MIDIKKIDVESESPIFIAGSKRGGTTLLRRIIDNHSLVTIPPPDWIYHSIYPILYSYGNLSQEENILELIKDILRIPMGFKHWDIQESPREIYSLLPELSFRGVLVTVFRIYSNRFNSLHWGSKVPNNGFWAKEILDDFPKARFLFLYRDGRDVSIDMVNAWNMNYYIACKWWMEYTQVMLESKNMLNSKSYYEIYYEELVAEPEKTLKNVCRFLDLKYEPFMLRYYEQEPDTYLKALTHAKTHKSITSEYVGMYRKIPLADRQLQIALIGDTLKQLGYSVEDEPREIGFWERLRYMKDQRSRNDELREYKNWRTKRSLERKEKGIWRDEDRIRFIQKKDQMTS